MVRRPAHRPARPGPKARHAAPFTGEGGAGGVSGGEHWAIEVKRSTTPKVERGFHSACDDIKPVKKWVIYPGAEAYPLADDIEVLPLHAAMREVAGRRGDLDGDFLRRHCMQQPLKRIYKLTVCGL